MRHPLAVLLLAMFLFFSAANSTGTLPAFQISASSLRSLDSALTSLNLRTETEDGFVLGLQRVGSSSGIVNGRMGPPVLLIHGLFMAADAWFLNSANQSLGFILADRGFDVWVGNVRGTRWSYGHVSLSEKDKDFWDWSWQELALYDLVEMTRYIYSLTNSKVLIVGHSQPNIVEMVEGAAFLCPISYLDHITSTFVRRLVNMYLDEVILALGIHELNFKSDICTQVMDMMCNGHLDCADMLSAITVIRKGTFAKYDYGRLKNLKLYGQMKPPEFDLSEIPSSLPLWMGYGGNDALADVTDVERTINELQSKPDLLYLDDYGHIDFLLSVSAKEDVYDSMIGFFKSLQQNGRGALYAY
nr:triacylglycerol lipase 1 [Ipomoea batatas]GMD01926.1 triacylglycerol lipase 1 [Ipomoea batatas]GME07638.1 triacylglycerol lipase 1 [Ipomoea batatas]